MSEHTPGPWRVHDEFILAGGEGRGGRVIAMNHDRIHYECEPENEANAHLIAAAPDLLAACIDTLVEMREAGWTCSCSAGYPACAKCKIRAAVAKAQGLASHDGQREGAATEAASTGATPASRTQTGGEG